MSPAVRPARQALCSPCLCAFTRLRLVTSSCQFSLRRVSTQPALNIADRSLQEPSDIGNSENSDHDALEEKGPHLASLRKTASSDHRAAPIRKVNVQSNSPVPWRKVVIQDGTVSSFGPADLQLLKEARKRRDDIRLRNRTLNSLLKFKGDWSYDWRFSLKLLLLEQEKNRERGMKSDVPDSDTSPEQTTAYLDVSVHAIPRPEHWTLESFLAFVRAITASRISPSLDKSIYGDGSTKLHPSQAHIYQVQKTLLSLFDNESLQPFISTTACEVAIDFFLRHNMLASARRMLRVMNTSNIPMRTSTFNRILWSTAFHADLRNFTWFLNLMIEMNVPINNSTWCAFICAVESIDVKLKIYREMQQQGILEDVQSLQIAVRELIGQELKPPYTSMPDMTPFFDHMDGKYGAEWLSEKAGNAMCDILCGHQEFNKVLEVLEVMSQRKQGPTSQTMSAILENAVHARDTAWALKTVELFAARYKTYVDVRHMDRLFQLGRRTQSYNLCRLVWHYSCSRGWATYRMRSFVLQSMLRNTPEHAPDARTQWMKHAGKVICGVGLRREDPRLAALEAWTEPQQRTAQIKTVKEIMTQDLAVRVQESFPLDFARLFARAVRMDQAWAAKKKPLSLRRKMRMSVIVPLGLNPKRGSLFRYAYYDTLDRERPQASGAESGSSQGE